MKKLPLFFCLMASMVVLQASATSYKSAAIPPHLEFKYYGFYSVIDYTFMTNLNKEHDEYTDDYKLNGISAVVGWQWRKESAIGLGFSYLSDATGSFSQIPVFLEFRSHYMRSRLTPFSSIRMGYTIPFGSVNAAEDYTRIDKGGITMGVDVGARFALRQKLGINVHVGYQMLQNSSVERGFNSVAATCLPELYHNIKFGIGVNF